MNKKWRLWRWLAFASILVGIVLAMFQPTLNDTANPGDFAWPAIALRLFGFVPICFFAFALLVVLFRFSRPIFRWLFTWRTQKSFLRAFVVLMFLAALFYAEEDWRGKHDWENCKNELEAKGEKLDFASFVPPPVPDDQNFALTPIVASCYAGRLHWSPNEDGPANTNLPMNRLEMKTYRADYNGSTNLRHGSWQKATFTDLKAWQDYYRTTTITNSYLTYATKGSGYVTNLKIQALAPSPFPVAPAPQSPAADVLLALSKFDPAIEELRQASHLPYSRFPLDYTTRPAYEIRVPHLQTIRNCAQVLSLRSVAELVNGQNEKAFDDVRLILHLANSIRDEPLAISQDVRALVFNYALQPIWEGQARHEWTDAQLAVLETDLSRFDYLASYQLSARADRAARIGLFEDVMQKLTLRKLYKELRTDTDDDSFGWSDFDQDALLYLMPHGWFYRNEVFVAHTFQQALLTYEAMKLRIVSPAAIRHSSDIVVSEFEQQPFHRIFGSGALTMLNSIAERMAREQASVDLARTACALERYHLAHGEYPETLDALVPQFIEKLPHDIINGQPLHYRREANGQFVLYSVGWNETDDGGQIGLNKEGRFDWQRGDWVWQYPVR